MEILASWAQCRSAADSPAGASAHSRRDLVRSYCQEYVIEISIPQCARSMNSGLRNTIPVSSRRPSGISAADSGDAFRVERGAIPRLRHPPLPSVTPNMESDAVLLSGNRSVIWKRAFQDPRILNHHRSARAVPSAHCQAHFSHYNAYIVVINLLSGSNSCVINISGN
jgi:hypothetical protein